MRDPTVRRRLFLYLGIIQLRCWILYVFLNVVEELAVASSGHGTECWYRSFLSPGQDTCQGRTTDFSDRIVLYFAQILPIALTEALHSFVVPYWNGGSSMPELAVTWDEDDNGVIEEGERSMTATTGSRITTAPALLMIGLMHLYCITLLGAYKTSAFFHTTPEIMTGYAVSLIVQVPMFLLQCTNRWPKLREYFFGFYN